MPVLDFFPRAHLFEYMRPYVCVCVCVCARVRVCEREGGGKNNVQIRKIKYMEWQWKIIIDILIKIFKGVT